MTNHLADCDDYAFSGAGFHPNCERICICRQVRRIEKRVLDAAREAVANALAIGLADSSDKALYYFEVDDDPDGGGGYDVTFHKDSLLTAIDALREKP